MTTEEINEIHAGGGGICPNCDVEMNQVIEGGIDRFRLSRMRLYCRLF